MVTLVPHGRVMRGFGVSIVNAVHFNFDETVHLKFPIHGNLKTVGAVAAHPLQIIPNYHTATRTRHAVHEWV